MATVVLKEVTALKPIEHISRTFHNFPGSKYVLPADAAEHERLLLQHKVLNRAFQNRLVLAPVNLDKAQFVLDSGTGAGVWLTDLSLRISPSSILHGIDIEGRLFPSGPAGIVSFSINSVTNLPPEWSGRFDLVHQRLLLAALTNVEWPKAVEEMFKALRPGGWIQLGEAGPWHAGENNAKLVELIRTLFVSRGLLLDIANDLPNLLKEAGFINIVIQAQDIPLGAWAGEEGCEGRDNFMGVFRGMKTPILRSGGLGIVDSEAALDKIYDAAEQEWNEHHGATLTFYIAYAQKPFD
ncbi:S-adenosyl-L-methionine-dependent methyltransferase [Guyanagaster necrorhizus]|uniref:S-adenosyl-L-methionine-dependent methyltransferase n=1 Tax=Guyanagaster necrorhizus TaxID=856835 RepID=A0A9P7VJN1_9AGAR|nr:S-adenosyl-L-methionine-dependent methyltransferase [Guyanagaster necrorhizus MCA 3950]KAG7441924.1 S-adenosyl-L-methionine-dependent methyltransferase [Guyanagaster necrorhizus MCA 3950]